MDHPRILFVSHPCYLDDSDGAAVGGRALMEALCRRGFGAEVVCGTALGLAGQADFARWLAGRSAGADPAGPGTIVVAPHGGDGGLPPHLRLSVGGVPIAIHYGPTTEPHEPDEAERHEFLRLYEATLGRFRPDLVVADGGGRLMGEVLARATSRGVATVLRLHGLLARDEGQFRDADAILVPTRLSAAYHREAFGLRCAVLPDLVDPGRVRADRAEARYATFVDPTPGRGVYAFARIAEELGRRRPDIPLLVVEGRGTAATAAACGIDLRLHGNVYFAGRPPDPKEFWRVSRACLVPSLGPEGPALVAAEAMTNGIPVIASDRGALPETLGRAGAILPLPGRLTPATRMLPTAEEILPWVEAMIRLWDDADRYTEQSRLALAESRRWAPEELEPRYVRFFEELRVRRRVPDPITSASTEPDAAAGRSTVEPSGPIGSLAAAFPWPDRRPTVEAPSRNRGWLGEGTERALTGVLSRETRLVVELGAWLGMSSRHILDHAPNAVLISVDHWQGSPEHRARDEFRAMLPTLYEAFLSECWEYRERLIPLRMTSVEGLRTVADHGLRPDLIYVDAEHSYAAVASELELARQLFPRATVVGDDYDWEGVARAVNEFAGHHGRVVERIGRRGWKVADRRAVPCIEEGPGPGRVRSAVLVPHLNGIEWECEQGLRQLEGHGVRVIRRGGSSAIDAARNVLASDAVHDGFESILFIDSDIGFDPADALRLLARPEPVVCGIYAKKGQRGLASHFSDGVGEVLFGPDAPGLYPVRFAATGFLRVKADVLRAMADRLELPLCNTKWGRGVWPFFMPLIIPHDGDKLHYLGEDWAFSHRLGLIGVAPLADTSVRLWHWGRYGYGWEDSGSDVKRYRSYNYTLGEF